MPKLFLHRIAEALDRMAPVAVAEADIESGQHFRWNGSHLAHVASAPTLALERFVGIDAQRAALAQNMAALAQGVDAHDMLLWGARGTGKSALLRSVAEYYSIALVEAGGDRLGTLPALFARLSGARRPFIVYVDDLAFQASDPSARILRSLLDGGVAARPVNVRLAVTSNHRHLVERDASQSGTSSPRHSRDHLDDQLALVDRFGLVLGFHVPTQDEYLEMVRRHLEPEGLVMDETDALAFALARGGRSGRTAWHYRTECLARRVAASFSLDIDNGSQ